MVTVAGRPRPVRLGLYLPGTALSLVALLTIGTVLHLAVLSHLQYARTQQVALSDFRVDLARGTAPVGQYRTDEDGAEHLVGPGSPMAVMRIPAVGLEAVVFEGTSGGVLRQGPGHRRDSVYPGQPGTSIVMGRKGAYGGPFRDLEVLIPGDLVTFVTGQAETEHVYRVTAVRRPGDPVPPPPASGTGRLTLLTATGRAFIPTDVLRVDAELVSAVQPASPRRFGVSALPPAESALATDQDAWVPLLLWAQALLLAAFGVAYLRARFTGGHAWVVGVPLLGGLGLAAVDTAVRLLPNLL